MKKTDYTYFAIPIIAIGLTWLLAAFVNWSFDLSDLKPEMRGFLVFVWFAISFAGCLFYRITKTF